MLVITSPRIAALYLASVSFCSLDAFAQEALEEIVVTADLRGRPASEVPGSVALFDARAIENAAVQHFEELIALVPNLNWSGDGNRARYLQIRGVGELEQYEGAPNPSVGFIVDDIDFSGIGGIATLFDVERLEVLRGPQGSRYGANALAGLIYLQSAEPDSEWSGFARVSGGEDGLLSGGLAVSGPLTASGELRGRASLHRHVSDGFRDNAFLDRADTNGRRETTARAKLFWDAGNAWSFRAAAVFVNADNGYDAFALDNGLTVLSDQPGQDAQESIGASLRAEWSGLSDLTFTSITSFADSDIDFSFDADWGNPQSWSPFIYDFVSETYRKRRTVSQELRVAKDRADRAASWVAGLYFLDLDESLETRNRGVYDDPVVFFFSDTLDERLASRFAAQNVAAFGQYELAAGARGRLTAGLRVEYRSADYTDSNALRVDPGETLWGGELSYRHEFSDAVSGYATLSRGYKAGGFNLGPVPEGGRQFGDEVLWNVELGAKSRWFDGKLVLNTAVFLNRRDDQQVRTSTQLNPNDPASFVFFTDNAARGETLGLEADGTWRVSDTLSVVAGIGLLDATFASFRGSDADLSGRRQAHAPAYSVNLGAIYRGANGVFARVDAIARDDFFFDVSHDQKSSEYRLVNLRVGVERERWGASLWARNLFDVRYAVRGFFFGNEPPEFPNTLFLRLGDPRQVGVTFEARF